MADTILGVRIVIVVLLELGQEKIILLKKVEKSIIKEKNITEVATAYKNPTISTEIG
jgi:hypothetical protein